MRRKWWVENHDRIVEYRKKFKVGHPDYYKNYAARFKIKLKSEVLNHYGRGKARCLICKEKRIECLSIDHINGGGNQHRKKIGGGGSIIYGWLKRNGYPFGYRVLCANCQILQRYNKYKTR